MRPRPSNPAAPRKRPRLFWPQPRRNLGKTSLDVRVRVSLAKNPTENDESPYWMPYTHVLFDAHPGILPVHGKNDNIIKI